MGVGVGIGVGVGVGVGAGVGGVVEHPFAKHIAPGKKKPCISAHCRFVLFAHVCLKSQHPSIGIGVGVGVGAGVGGGMGVGDGVGVMQLPSMHSLVLSSKSHISPSQIGSSHWVHTNAEHGISTTVVSPISASCLQIAINMPSPSINLASNIFRIGNNKSVTVVGPSVETGIVSFIVGKSPVTISSITAPLKFGCNTLEIDSCSLDNSLVGSVKNSSGSSMKRLIEVLLASPPVPPPQESK